MPRQYSDDVFKSEAPAFMANHEAAGIKQQTAKRTLVNLNGRLSVAGSLAEIEELQGQRDLIARRIRSYDQQMAAAVGVMRDLVKEAAASEDFDVQELRRKMERLVSQQKSQP